MAVGIDEARHHDHIARRRSTSASAAVIFGRDLRDLAAAHQHVRPLEIADGPCRAQITQPFLIRIGRPGVWRRRRRLGGSRAAQRLPRSRAPRRWRPRSCTETDAAKRPRARSTRTQTDDLQTDFGFWAVSCAPPRFFKCQPNFVAECYISCPAQSRRIACRQELRGTDDAYGISSSDPAADYRAPDWLIETVELDFALDPAQTRVRAKLTLMPSSATSAPAPLVLDGDDLTLVALSIDGKPLAAGVLCRDAGQPDDPAAAEPPFTLEIETPLDPSANTKLMGLYRSSGTYCTQCEAEGFRRITYFLGPPRRDGRLHDADRGRTSRGAACCSPTAT